MPQSNLLQALQYLQTALQARLNHHFSKEPQREPFKLPPITFAQNDGQPFTQFIQQTQLKSEELLVVLLALVPHVYPNFLDSIISTFLPSGGNFPEFGGIKGKNHRGTLPTGETALFLLAGNDLERRFQVQPILSMAHFLVNEKVIYLEDIPNGEPAMSGRLIIDPDYVDLFTLNMVTLPKMSSSFPAEHLSTQMDWDDLVLNPSTFNQIKELETWVRHHHTLMHDWGMQRKLKPGYRALFHGPPGTGKTLTATLLGKSTGQDVFRIDLSNVVSKYIGETEKNLANLFDKAQNKNWILFFDEADAIFGKRTGVRDAHDKYANQEVSYLLQRIESYPGLTILASNFKTNIDEAFVRRFNAIIYFPSPKANERAVIWKKAFPAQAILAANVDLDQIAQKYELTGSHIMNITQYVCLQALEKKTNIINAEDLRQGIVRELMKEGKTA